MKRVAYADPPYLGVAAKHYAKHHEHAADFDTLDEHLQLIQRIDRDFDGWALSLSAPSLRHILPHTPDDSRVMAWVKPFASFKPGVGVAYAWEPVIVKPARDRGRDKPTVRDWVAANIAMQRGMPGAKPTAFCLWLFDVLGLEPDDDFHDLFPGSGAVMRAHAAWLGQPQAGVLFEAVSS